MQVIYQINGVTECGEVTKDFTHRASDRGVYVKHRFGERWIPSQNIVSLNMMNV